MKFTRCCVWLMLLAVMCLLLACAGKSIKVRKAGQTPVVATGQVETVTETTADGTVTVRKKPLIAMSRTVDPSTGIVTETPVLAEQILDLHYSNTANTELDDVDIKYNPQLGVFEGHVGKSGQDAATVNQANMNGMFNMFGAVLAAATRQPLPTPAPPAATESADLVKTLEAISKRLEALEKPPKPPGPSEPVAPAPPAVPPAPAPTPAPTSKKGPAAEDS